MDDFPNYFKSDITKNHPTQNLIIFGCTTLVIGLITTSYSTNILNPKKKWELNTLLQHEQHISNVLIIHWSDGAYIEQSLLVMSP